MGNPLISVLIPVFNESRNFLKQCIQSVLDQSLTDFEILLLDDGSDNPLTLRAIEEVAALNDRTIIQRFSHRGLTPTLNSGLGMARGTYIVRLDSNDWCETIRLQEQVSFLDQNRDIALVGSNIALHRSDGVFLWNSSLPENPVDIRAAFHDTNPFVHAATCFTKTAAMAVGGYRESLRFAEDYDFFWRISELYSGANLQKSLTHVRFSVGSKSSEEIFDQEREVLTIRELARQRSYGDREDLTSARELAIQLLPETARESFGNVRRGDFALLAGHYRLALNLYFRGFAARPWSIYAGLKMLRCLLFILCPCLRAVLFANKTKQLMDRLKLLF